MRFGFHVSIGNGWRKTVQRAIARRCNTLQVFTSAPVQWERKPLDAREVEWFARACPALDIQPVFVHAIYLLNLATPNGELWRKSRDNLAEELSRASQLGTQGVVVHLGSVGERGTVQAGIKRVARALDYALRNCRGDAEILLENCAGQGNLVGCTPGQMGGIIEHSALPERLAVCIDTAHAFAGGHAIHTPDGLDEYLAECDAAFGLGRIKLIHANDSRTPLGSNADRHWHIGKGDIGKEGFGGIVNHELLRGLPFIMETPDQDKWHAKDMRAIRSLVAPEFRTPLPRIRELVE